MSKRGRLPVLQPRTDLSGETVTKLRERLGGRLTGEPKLLAGAIVTRRSVNGPTLLGVVLCADQSHADVLMRRGVVKRIATNELVVAQDEPSPELLDLAKQTRVFGSLTEGQPVNVEQTPGTAPVPALLREKCRFGGLVELEDGRILAVGFARLWPAVASGGIPDRPS